MINQGKLVGVTYIKSVSFAKAVLWKDRAISLTPAIVARISGKAKLIVFEDAVKNERWTVSMENFLKNSTRKKVGQEEQYYCPISLFRVEPIVKREIQLEEQLALPFNGNN